MGSVALDAIWKRNLAGRIAALLACVCLPLLAVGFGLAVGWVDHVLPALGSARSVTLAWLGMAVALVVTLAALGITTAAILVTRRVRRTLDMLRHAADCLGRGHLAYRLPIEETDGLDDVARVFNSMAAGLEARYCSLEERATRDSLTDLFNHREFHRLLDEETERAQRYGRPLCVLLIDVDDFKRVNDRFGHPVGDRVLRLLANTLREATRRVDVVARPGGDEFAILLPETSSAGGQVIAHRLTQAVAEHPFWLPDGGALHIEISLGLAFFPEDASTAEALVEVADRRLYAAKHGNAHGLTVERIALPGRAVGRSWSGTIHRSAVWGAAPETRVVAGAPSILSGFEMEMPRPCES
jgi:diguanylate cyclase (GGDEF)-like protein